MNNIIIVTGHGNYATGIKSMIEMVSGPNENIYYIDFTKNDTDITLAQKFGQIISQKYNILFACDLLGGTPYKEAAKLAFTNQNIKVVAGCNVGSIMDCAFKLQTLTINELANNMIESSKKNLFILDTNIKQEKNTTDGI